MNMRAISPPVAVLAVLLCSCVAVAQTLEVSGTHNPNGGGAAGTVAKAPRAYEDYRIVPVRVHLLRDSETHAAVTHLTEKDITRIFAKANGIWHAAGVHLWVESIVTEKPVGAAGFDHAASLPTEALLALRPEDSRKAGMFHVYYVGAMTPNGIFIRRDAIFVKDSARLRQVEGGIDEPLPRVTAHELGHGMGLPHRQDTFNLLASGTTGTGLNDAEVEIVRNNLAAKLWVETPEQFLKAAEQTERDKKPEAARSMYLALREIPGESPIKRRAGELVAVE